MPEIELILKSPTDRIAPFSVKCNTLWTIEQLKFHVVNVYPCKPTVESQKFIYVGKLLRDNQVLKDIFENNSSAIVHFICQPSLSEIKEDVKVEKDKLDIPQDKLPELISQYQQYISNFYASNSQSFFAMNPYQQMMWINQAYTQSYANYLEQFEKTEKNVKNSPNTETIQSPVVSDVPVSNQENLPNDERRVEGVNADNGVQNMMAAAFGGLMGDDGEEENGGEAEPRDVLHYFYIFVRFGMLILICYYYSSMVSVITTLTLFFLFFGVNMLRRNNNRNQGPTVARETEPVRQQEPPQPQSPNEDDERVSTVPENVINENHVDMTVPPIIALPTITERLRRVASTSFQFVFTFFVTLFPEPMGHININ